MESSSSAIVDFGRFCTGFLVVMGVGMSCIITFVTTRTLQVCQYYAYADFIDS